MTLEELKIIQNRDELMLSIMSGDTVIRGPKDSFSEAVGTNIALIRRRINSPNLWIEPMKVGRVTQTQVVLMYVKGIVNDDLVQEVKQRINRIDTDGI